MGRNWIKIETVTCDKPEVCVIATQLKVDPDMVVGKLVRLWSWAEVNRINGNEMNVTFEFIDKLVGKKGFGAALAKAGWLKEVGDKLQFPNFGRHNGPTGKGRALTAQRVSRHRDRKRNSDDEVTNNEISSEHVTEVKRSVRTKPRNERRNTVKELIESELTAENTNNEELIIAAEISVIDSEMPINDEEFSDGSEVVQVPEFDEVGELKPDELETVDDIFVDEVEYEDVTISEDDSYDDQVGAGEMLETEFESRIEPESHGEGNVSASMEREGDEPHGSESDEVPAQKGRKGRGGLGPQRKIIVPETPDQPLLF